MKKKNIESIEEALKILNAAAKDEKNELLSELKDNYQDLKGVVVDVENKINSKLHDIKDSAQASKSDVKLTLNDLAEDIEDATKNDPWKAIKYATFAGAMLGFLIGSNRNK